MVEETFEPGMGKPGGAPAWRCAEPAVDLATAGSTRLVDGRWQW
jgi:hypothetical protein